MATEGPGSKGNGWWLCPKPVTALDFLLPISNFPREGRMHPVLLSAGCDWYHIIVAAQGQAGQQACSMESCATPRLVTQAAQVASRLALSVCCHT